MIHLPYNRKQWMDSYVIIGEEEVDVRVGFKWVKAELDVGFNGGIELYDVDDKDGDVMEKMTDAELDELVLRIGEGYEDDGE